MSAFGTSTNVLANRQDDTTNSTASQRIETGWGVMTPGVSNQASETVTFQTPFAARPIVVICAGGDAVSATTYGSGGNIVQAANYAKAHSITTSSFVAQINAPSNYAAGNTVFYQWIAIG
jgi:hypothetical protein